jgi:hypothetical protein
MARVYPGKSFIAGTGDRNIITSTKGNDLYYYRNSIQHLDTDPRIKSSAYEKIQKDLMAVSKIWNNRPECWKDHFRRSYRDYTFGYKSTEKQTKRLTGYNLYYQLMLQSFNRNKSLFYDPPCFCIQPVDPLGEKIHSLGHFTYNYHRKVHYKYDEQHELQYVAGCVIVKDNPFRSSAFSGQPLNREFFLAVPWSYPRWTENTFAEWNWKDLKNVVLWPPLTLCDSTQPPEAGIHLWDCCLFHWISKGECDCPPGGLLHKCFVGYYIGEASASSLCDRHRVKISCSYTKYGINIKITHSGGPPYKYVYLDDNLLGVIGCGPGDKGEIVGGLSYLPPRNNQARKIGLTSHNEPCELGITDCNKPDGEMIGLSDPDFSMSRPCSDGTGATHFDYIFDMDKTRQASPTKHTPHFRVVTEDPIYDSRGFQNWCPWGGIKVYLSNDRDNWQRSFLGTYSACCSPGVTEYCFDNNYTNIKYRHVLVQMMNTTVWPCCTQTRLDDLQMLDRIPDR